MLEPHITAPTRYKGLRNRRTSGVHKSLLARAATGSEPISPRITSRAAGYAEGVGHWQRWKPATVCLKGLRASSIDICSYRHGRSDAYIHPNMLMYDHRVIMRPETDIAMRKSDG